MQKRTVVGWILIAAGIGLVGCAGEVDITHTLPSAVPLPDGLRPLSAGRVSVTGADEAEFAPMVRETLSEQLKRIDRMDANAQAGLVDVEIDVTVTDTRGTRTVRRGRPDGEMKTVTLPTLVRKVDVRAEFPVRYRRNGGEPIVTLSVMRSYDSRRDPRVWGELALGRAADPNRVPSGRTVLRELLADSVRRGVDLLRQGRIAATVPLKPTWNPIGQRGLDAMKEGEYTKASRLFANALKDDPTDVSLLFDHAVACEADGQLSRALMGYRKVLQAGDDEHALAGAKRVQTVIDHRENALPGARDNGST